MTNEDLKDVLTAVVSAAKQVNLLTGDHASANYYEAEEKQQGATRTEEAIKRAVKRLMDEKDEEGRYIVTEQGQFYAVKAVLTSPLCGLPAKPGDFGRVLHNLELDSLRVRYDYETVRKVHPHQLPANVELWHQYEHTADEYSLKQVKPAVRLIALLKEEAEGGRSQ